MTKMKKPTKEKEQAAPTDSLSALLAERSRLQGELADIDARVGGEKIEEIKQIAADKKRAWDRWNKLDQQLHALGGEKILKEVEAARGDLDRQLAKVSRLIAQELGLPTEGMPATAAKERRTSGKTPHPTEVARAYVLTKIMSDQPMIVPQIVAAANKADGGTYWTEDKVRQAMMAYACFECLGRGKGYVYHKPQK